MPLTQLRCNMPSARSEMIQRRPDAGRCRGFFRVNEDQRQGFAENIEVAGFKVRQAFDFGGWRQTYGEREHGLGQSRNRDNTKAANLKLSRQGGGSRSQQRITLPGDHHLIVRHQPHGAMSAGCSAAMVIEQSENQIGLAASRCTEQENSVAVDGNATAVNDGQISHRWPLPECGR